MTSEQWRTAKRNLAQREQFITKKLETINKGGADFGSHAALHAELGEIQNTRRRLRRTIGSRGRFLAFSQPETE